MRNFILSLSLVACLWLASHSPAAEAASPEQQTGSTAADSPQLAAFKAVIRQKYDLKERAFAAHDAEPILTNFYAEDAISVGVGFGIYKGRAQLRPLYEGAVKDLAVKVTSRHTVLNGDAGWDWADFYVTPVDAAQPPFNLVIVFLWSRENGAWICKGDFFAAGDFATGTILTPAP